MAYLVMKGVQCKGSISSVGRESNPNLTPHFWTKRYLDLKILSFKTLLKKFLQCFDARILLNVALFGKPSKDKVKMNERELKSLKNLSKHLV